MRVIAFVFAALLCGLAQSSQPTTAPNAAGFVESFEAPSEGWVDGFSRGDPARVGIEKLGASSFLRFRTEVGQSALVSRELELPPDSSLVRVIATTRSSELMPGEKAHEAAGVQTVFLAADRSQVGGWPPAMLVRRDAKDWGARARTYVVPPGATAVRITAGLWGCSGTFDVDQLEVEIYPKGKFPPPSQQQMRWSFEPDEGEWPENFSRGDGASTKIANEGENYFLRITRQEKASAIVSTPLLLDPKWGAMSVDFRMRVTGLDRGDKDFLTAQAQVMFFDADSKQVGGWPPRMEVQADTQGWVPMSHRFEIPAGAVRMTLAMGLWGCAGTVDFDDVSITPHAAGELPQGQKLQWGEEPVVSITPQRGEIVLNGIWKFCPVAADSRAMPAEGEWGFVRVPGRWNTGPNFPGIVSRGRTGRWLGVDLPTAGAAWYQRTIECPPEWEGRRIQIRLDRVSTDAKVFVDSALAGSVNWPGGVVDLTRLLKPGRSAVLSVLVIASDDKQQVLDFMGTADSQVSVRNAVLETRGLIGDVILTSLPRGATIARAFVRTSTRANELSIGLKFDGEVFGKSIRLRARMLDQNGTEEKAFEGTVVPDVEGQAEIRWKWPDARRWDVGRPELYTLRLSAMGENISDEVAQTFGFREFWIDGRDFYLNGTRIRLRPLVLPTQYTNAHGTREAIAAAVRGALENGFNFGQIWPVDDTRRGVEQFWHMWYEEADRAGLLLGGVAPAMQSYITAPGYKYQWDQTREEYATVVPKSLAPVLNHPSVVMWGTSANFFGDSQDQNPLNIGRRVFENTRFRAAGREGVAIIKSFDPTRPVFTHHGADVGDVHTMNTYLGLLPLQEREQWLSHHANAGEMPFLAVELGTPLFTNFHRGRNGFGNVIQSEPLWPEFLAMYLGEEAYAHDTPAYRSEVVGRFVRGQQYKSWHANNEVNTQSEPFQRLQELFVRNTWRSWRVAGISGGMVPWDNAYAWSRSEEGNKMVTPGRFTPGRRGHAEVAMRSATANPYRPPAVTTTPAGRSLLDSNGPTLAYIAGAPVHTDKRHQFAAGQKLAKHLAVVSDLREPSSYELSYAVLLGGKPIVQQTVRGMIAPATTTLIPMTVDLPSDLGADRVDGFISLEGAIGGQPHKDRFEFRVYRRTNVEPVLVAMVDPKGLTRRTLEAAGYRTESWNGGEVDLLVVGREAFTELDENKNRDLLRQLEQFVRRGGRAVIFAQRPDYYAQRVGFRVAPYVSRRVFPVNAAHPVLRGIDAIDLRDWSASTTLIDARPDATAKDVPRGAHNLPKYGWRWGNEGMVTAAPLEKPHHAGWRPILQCEFDLAWSPLMELDYGLGRVVLSQLEFEDNIQDTPAAGRLLTQLLDYARSAPLRRPASEVYCVGLEHDEAAMVRSLGLAHKPSDKWPASAGSDGLVIVGRNASINDEVLVDFAKSGGRVLLLARRSVSQTAGIAVSHSPHFDGDAPPDWGEARGIGVSELRTRADLSAYLARPSAGVETSTRGLLARRLVGKGVIVAIQADPAALDADSRTYLRYTRWRQTRLITQVAANLGAEFVSDGSLFRGGSSRSSSIALAGTWEATWTRRLVDATGEAEHEDPGVSKEARHLLGLKPEMLGKAKWDAIELPGAWERCGIPGWDEANGEAVFVRRFTAPENWAGRELELSMGTIDDRDITAINGVIVGQSPDGAESQWNVKRVYRVPPSVIKPGANTLVVRVWDRYREGGFTGDSRDLSISLPRAAWPVGLYHSDYREDFELGDDPFRYYRW